MQSKRSAYAVFFVIGNTFEHYFEHLPWMQAITEKKSHAE